MTPPLLIRAAQGIAAALLLIAAAMKFAGDPTTIEIFSRLDMDPGGRYVIAVIELAAALLLLSPLAALGSVIATAVMCGAIIAHVTELGLVVNDDGGRLIGMLVVVLGCVAFVLVSRRKEIPLVGKTL